MLPFAGSSVGPVFVEGRQTWPPPGISFHSLAAHIENMLPAPVTNVAQSLAVAK
jgi:hypothetical protein